VASSESEFGEIILERDKQREDQIRTEINDAFYASRRIDRIKRALGLKTYPPHRNITAWNAHRGGYHLFDVVDVNDGRNDRLKVEMTPFNEPVRFVNSKRRPQQIEFNSGERSIFPSEKALLNFCVDATGQALISKQMVDLWIEKYEIELRSISRSARIVSLAKRIYRKCSVLFSDMPAFERVRSEICVFLEPLILILIVVVHNEYGEAEEISKRELDSITEKALGHENRERHVVLLQKCLEYLKLLNSRDREVSYIDLLKKWLDPMDGVILGNEVIALDEVCRNLTLDICRTAIRSAYNFEWIGKAGDRISIESA
jgi:hypothetical protein